MSRSAFAVIFLASFFALPAGLLADQPVPRASRASAVRIAPRTITIPAEAGFPALKVATEQNQPQAPEDDTLRAMKDEMARSLARLQTESLGKPFYVSYRLLDVQVRSVTADFGSLVNSSTSRSRFMLVDVRMGNYHIDSSNFITSGGFQGSIGNAGQVGIDGDYYSLRQDLWLATDQAYKQAADMLARKQAFLSSLAKPPEIDDFSKLQQPPVVLIEPHAVPDWTARDWDKEAEDTSTVFRSFPGLYSGRVTYYMVYTTYYLLTSEGTELRVPSSSAAVEAAVQTQAPDGMPLHDFYSAYSATPAGLPTADVVKQHLQAISQELTALRAAPAIPDYDGPILFEPHAAAPLLAQLLAPSISGARPPLSTVPMFDQMFSQLGGRSDWTGRIGQRVLPPNVSLVDDPGATEFQGQPLIGGYQVDAEGVKGQKVTLVQNGMLEDLLMSRRPGPDLTNSNGHGRAADLGAPSPSMSNLFFDATGGLDQQQLKQKFLDICKSDGLPWCLVVKTMDNPALAAIHRGDFNDMLSGVIGSVSNGGRLPLIVERMYTSDGHEELVRGARISGLALHDLRRIAGIGNDPTVFNFMQNPQFADTALAPFGAAQGGMPTSIVCPSLLLEDVEVRGPHGGETRPPLVAPPPMQPQ